MLLGVLAAVAIVLVVVLAVVLPVGDRLLAGRAETAAAAALAEPLGGAPVVSVTSRPFLPQLVRGVYRDIDVRGVVRLGAIDAAGLTAHLTNVHLPARTLLSGRTTEVACERVAGRVLIDYDDIAGASSIPGLRLRYDGDDLKASAALTLPGFSQLVRVRGVAELRHVETSTVWLRIRGISVVGVQVPSILWNQILPVFNVPIRLPDLPYGLRIDELRPTAQGLVVNASAVAVVFTATPTSDP